METQETVKTRIDSYLTFKLGKETFASNVSKVLNILEMTNITEVPKAPAYMKGVINLRGSVLPLIDTRIKFGMSETEFTTNTCILVLEVTIDNENVRIGALVDSVQEVLEIKNADILPPPSIGNKYKSDFIEGMAKKEDEFVMILDIEQIFSTEEILDLKEISSEAVTQTEEKQTKSKAKKDK